MFKVMGMMLIVPSVMLLTASFFVLLGISVAKDKWVRTFGWVVAVLLWIACLAVFSMGTMISSNGEGKWMNMRHRMMTDDCCKMMMQGGMKDKMGGRMDKMDPKAKTVGHCVTK